MVEKKIFASQWDLDRIVKVKKAIKTNILVLSKNYDKDPLIEEIIEDLKARFSGHIISVFGIGSYFDRNLPPNWVKNDVDLIAIVDSLEHIPKQDWTEVRYEKIRRRLCENLPREFLSSVFTCVFTSIRNFALLL